MALLAGPALAEEQATHTDNKHRYSVSAPEAFRFTKADSLLGSYAGPGKLRMSLSRIDFPSLAAWRKREQKEFFESVVDGARDATADFRKKGQQSQRLGGVPTLDLHFSRKGGQELVWMRFAFYRKYSIVASASTPAAASRAHRRMAKDFARSLQPLRDPAQ